jgi:hypothetical protein
MHWPTIFNFRSGENQNPEISYGYQLSLVWNWGGSLQPMSEATALLSEKYQVIS